MISKEKKIYFIVYKFVLLLGLLIVSYVTLNVFLFRFDDCTAIPIKQNPLIHAGIALFIVIISWVIDYITRNFKKKTIVVFDLCSILVCSLAIAIMGVTYVTQVRSLNISDQKSCYDLAIRFLNSDFNAVVPKDSYLSLWPHQFGFLFIMEKLMRVFHSSEVLLFQKINVFFHVLLYISGYGILRSYTKKTGPAVFYTCLTCTCLPVFFMTTYVYGNLPCMALMVMSLWMFRCMCLVSKKRWKVFFGILFSGATIFANMYKTTCSIYLVALILCLIMYSIHKKDVFLSFVVVVSVIVAANAPGIAQAYYEYYAQNQCGKGVPAIAFIAMGMQGEIEGDSVPGAWNGYHSNLYIETGYDREETIRISKESVRASLKYFQENPKYAILFYYNKSMKQWANQTHDVFWGYNYNYVWDSQRDENAYWVQYINNLEYKKLLPFMDYHESTLYLVLFLSMIYLVGSTFFSKREINFLELLPLITFIGGFLFSLLWEGQTRAVLYYPILLLPYSLCNVGKVGEVLGRKLSDKVIHRK